MVSKGYDRAQFEEIFSRYLNSADSAATSLQPNTDKAQSVAGDALRSCSENASATLQPLPDKDCSDVADKNGQLGGNGKFVAGDEAPFECYLPSSAQSPETLVTGEGKTNITGGDL